MTGAVLVGVPAASAEAARSTLGGALAEAGRLPDAAGVHLLGSARDAFVHAFGLAAWISVGISLATAVMIVVLLRDYTRDRSPEPQVR
jgi:DHA2 family multidrug resistance protein-like MFS transporter